MDQAQVWEATVGAAWARNGDHLEAHSAAFGTAALDRLGDVGGQRVLDVGCGTGTTTLDVAARGAADVLGVDLSQTMLDEAERKRVEAGASNVSFRCVDVTTLTADPPFDALCSRFGVMFFDDPVAGFSTLRGLVRPGGRLAFCCWTDPFANPWMLVPVMASAEALGPPALPAPGEPGPFSLGAEGRAQEVLEAAGWHDVTVETVDHEIEMTGGATAVAGIFATTNPVVALGLVRAPEQADAVRAAIARDLAPFEGTDGVVRMPGQARVVSARA